MEDEIRVAVPTGDLAAATVAAEVEADRKNDIRRMMTVIGVMTEDMAGIKAVCTGNIIRELWHWSTRDDLEAAKALIEYLIESDCYG